MAKNGHGSGYDGNLERTTRMPASISLDTESILQGSRLSEAERAR